ncbi:hypothetical protein [Campylobacter californiensis]|uniref:hypothetical protein n=1 Tax=Campylobacter californiensis TaxID=1032243 RepID=UPI0014755A3A|nr:hypothetical protein [Campylobacter sp. RM12916]MBE3609489.1 hypothetical protein [Campylobacter sp. RM12916]
MRVDQAEGLRQIVKNFENKGFKMSINAKGEITGVRLGKMIKGNKADYSSSLFRQIGRYIIRKFDGKIVDTAA